jgi:GNAT superfamily N-acetyltransferase
VAEIRAVRSTTDIEAARRLAWAFVAFLRERYPEMHAHIEAHLQEQNFRDQLADVRRYVDPPAGACVLAGDDGEPCGVVMRKAAGGRACGMNRLFVRPSARRTGTGRELCRRLMAAAPRAVGDTEMRVSALYRWLGFAAGVPFECGGDGPDPRVIFMRRRLEDEAWDCAPRGGRPVKRERGPVRPGAADRGAG